MTLQVRNGKMSMTDGPFMETKEVLGGFIWSKRETDETDRTPVASQHWRPRRFSPMRGYERSAPAGVRRTSDAAL